MTQSAAWRAIVASGDIKPDMIPSARWRVRVVAVMLAGNAYMTGQTIGVNGGMFM